jgi:TolB-like protein/Tfp pilus assembly protein PilF
MPRFSELKRRNVFRVAVLYLVASWVTLQVSDLLFDRLEVPEWSFRLVLGLLVLGFPLALIVAWVYEITPDGLKRQSEIDRASSVAPATGRRIEVVTIALLLVAIGLVFADRMVPPSIETRSVDATPSTPGEVSAADGGSSVAVPLIYRIAVLPAQTANPTPEQDWLGNGLVEEILNLLTKVPQLWVTPRTSAFAEKFAGLDARAIAEELNVDYLLEIGVRMVQERARITPRLVDARRDRVLWAPDPYETEVGNDLFATQDRIASAVVDALKLELLPSDRPVAIRTNPRTLELYLQGKAILELGSTEARWRAVDLLLAAVEIDPDYVSAWNELARAYDALAWDDEIPGSSGYWVSRETAGRAVAADPTSAEAHARLARAIIGYSRDFPSVRNHLQTALELAPADPVVLYYTSDFLFMTHQFERALDVMRVMTQRDPLRAEAWEGLAYAHRAKREFRESVDLYQKALELRPDATTYHRFLGDSLIMLDEPQAALTEYDREPNVIHRKFGQALAYFELGRTDEALRIMADLESNHVTWSRNIAEVYALSGDFDSAFDWLNRAVELHDVGLLYLHASPFLDVLHDDPRWQAVLTRIGLSDAGVANLTLELPELPEANER